MASMSESFAGDATVPAPVRRRPYVAVLLALIVIVGATSGVARPQDVPPQQLQAAQRAFAEGLLYYIWYEGPEPIVLQRYALPGSAGTQAGGASAQVVPVSFRYLAAGGNALSPYRIRTGVSATDAVSGGPVRLLTTSQEDIAPKYPSGMEQTLFGTGTAVLTGEGYLKVALIEPAGRTTAGRNPKSKAGVTEPRPISNILRIGVVSQDAQNRVSIATPAPTSAGLPSQPTTRPVQPSTDGVPGSVIVRTLTPPGGWWMFDVVFAPDGRWLVTNRGVDNKYAVFSTASGLRDEGLDAVEPYGHGRVAFSADGTLCAVRSKPRVGEPNLKIYRVPGFALCGRYVTWMSPTGTSGGCPMAGRCSSSGAPGYRCGLWTRERTCPRSSCPGTSKPSVEMGTMSLP